MRRFAKYFPLIIIIIICIGLFLRFYNLNWGQPLYFHPDERNIASSVVQLRFPYQLNPNFFAYGSLPIYIIYFTGLINNLFYTGFNQVNIFNPDFWLKINQVNFNDAILIGRIYSAFLSSVLLFLIFKIGKDLYSKSAGFLTTFLAVINVGLIQFAHFGTFEIWTAFFSLLLLKLSLTNLNEFKTAKTFLLGVIVGILVSVKINNLIVSLIPILSIIFSPNITSLLSKNNLSLLKAFKKITFHFLILILSTSFIFIVTNPYVILDNIAFQNSIRYESGVALGKIEVFYTQEFFDTQPIIFHLLKIFPFLINPILTIISIPSFLYIFLLSIKTKNRKYMLLLASFLILFLSQAFLFVKWTRYMVPTIPFLLLIIAISYFELSKIFKQRYDKSIQSKIVINIFIGITIIYSTIFSFAYFKTAFINPDTRIEAAQWLNEKIKNEDKIISEVYDIGVIAFNNSNAAITLCDFYNLAHNNIPCNNKTLKETLNTSNYFIMPSERLLKTSFLNRSKFPERYKFYNDLIKNRSEFKLIYKTPCDLLCQIVYLGDPLYSFEQTASVFDRPSVYIFKK